MALQVTTSLAASEAIDITVHYGGKDASIMAPAPALVWFEANVTGSTGLPTRTNGDVTANAEYDEYDQQFHELDFEWEFTGETGVWVYATRLPTQLQQKSYAHGKHTVTVFDTPGTKSVTCTAYRMDVDGSFNLVRNVVASKTITFNDSGGDYPSIPDVDVAIPENQRVYFNPTGDYSDLTTEIAAGATTGNDLAANTIWRVFEWAESQSFRPGVFIKRGSTTTYSANSRMPDEMSWLYCGTYGSGAKPIINKTGGQAFYAPGSFTQTGGDLGGFITFTGIDLRGTYDDVNETYGSQGGGHVLFGGEMRSHVLLHDCSFKNSTKSIVSFGINTGTFTTGQRSLVCCDSEFEGFSDYGFNIGGNALAAFRQWFGFIGSKVGQSEGSSNGWRGKDIEANKHGPMRIPRCGKFIFRASDNLSRVDWGARCQANIRLFTESPQQYGEPTPVAIIYGSAFEGGDSHVFSQAAGVADAGASLPPGGTRSYTFPANILIKHNWGFGAWTNRDHFVTQRSSTTSQENVTIRADVGHYYTGGTGDTRGSHVSVGMLSSADPEATNGHVPGFNDEVIRHPVRIRGNLLIDEKTTTQAADEATIASSTNISSLYEGWEVQEENTMYAPNYGTTPVTSTGPFDFVSFVSTRMTKGPRHDANVSSPTAAMTDNVDGNDVFDVDDSFATPANGLPIRRPASNASIAGAATTPMSHRDAMGVVRTAGQPASQGAIEPV